MTVSLLFYLQNVLGCVKLCVVQLINCIANFGCFNRVENGDMDFQGLQDFQGVLIVVGFPRFFVIESEPHVLEIGLKSTLVGQAC